MTVRELLAAVADHTAGGRVLEDDVIVLVGKERREVRASYANGTFILIAGKPIS